MYAHFNRWFGSVHDSTIFDNSLLRAQFENNEFGNSVLVGDGGYACRNYMMTPLGNPTSESELIYQVSKKYIQLMISNTN